MMRLALAAAVLAFAAAAHGSPHPNASPHAKASPRAKRAPDHVVRAVIDSGNPQTAAAYAEPAKSKYVTEFPTLLKVRVPAWSRDGGARRVRFQCVSDGCVLASTDQPNDGKFVDRVNPAAYDGHITNGTAFVKIAVEADRPAGVYTVTATPRTGKGERAVPATFTLTSR
jgi:hypothetical protein